MEEEWCRWSAEAARWAEGNGWGFSVAGTEESARNIFLSAPCGSFFVTVPEHVGTEEWGVWSNDEDSLAVLVENMDSFTAPSRTLSQVLDKSASCLCNKKTKDKEEEEEESMSDGEDSLSDADDGDDGMYYDEDESQDQLQHGTDSSPPQEYSADDFFTGQGSTAAVHRLLSDLKSLNKSAGKYGITGSPKGDNLFVWGVELSDFEKGSLLQRDLEAYARKFKRKPVVELEMKFPKDYPMNPPFVQVIRPRFKFLTGHVTVGGSVCMQMLTRSGWSPSNDIESILVQVRAEIMSDPKTSLDPHPEAEYSEAEAKSAFERMVLRYGWNRS